MRKSQGKYMAINRYKGITKQEALQRLELYGPNELQDDTQRGLLKISIETLKEPMVLLLLGIGAIYFFLGEVEEIISLLTFLILILGITIYQEKKTEKTLEALKKLSSPRAVVIREGQQQRIPGNEIVPGDLVILNEGDRVPADIKILNGGPLSIDESIITGESFPVDIGIKNDRPLALSGTLVIKGQALGEVLNTGQNTELGKIGKSLSLDKNNSTELQMTTRNLVKNLSYIVAALTAFIIIYYWVTRHQLLEGILVGLTLAMAILPNELPAVLLIFLALGAWRISKRNVLTRRVPAVEALGGITTLCTDKTGTLTQNKMEIRILWNGLEEIVVSSDNYDLPEAFHLVLEFGILASPLNPFDPMEKALQSTGEHFLHDTEHLHPEWKLSKEYQISDELLAVSYAWKSAGNNQFIVGAKGATEAIIDLCHLPDSKSKEIKNQTNLMASRGLRVIGVAKSFTPTLPKIQHDLNFEFLGLIGLEDPIRTDAKAAVEECQQAGINILMITGDHPITAMKIASELGLKNSAVALTGKDIEKMDDSDLQKNLKEVNIFCRMRPIDKQRIVSQLKKSGEIVAMTGDGVNDAPALRESDVGIAMGERGTDVAREAASIVLLDDNFSSIVAAIRIGRKTYNNLQEAFAYLLGIHIPITILSIVPVLFKLPLILLPVHIAFLHLIIEPACTTIFEARSGGPELMTVPPRKSGSAILSKSKLYESLIHGLIMTTTVIGVFAYALSKGLYSTDVRGITFTTLILSNLFLIFIMRGTKKKGEDQKLMLFLSATTVIMLGIVLYIPFFRELFRFEPLHFEDLALCLFASSGAAVGFKLTAHLFNTSKRLM